MANELDEIKGPVNEAGNSINVIEKQLPVKIGIGSAIFELSIWVLGFVPAVVFPVLVANKTIPMDLRAPETMIAEAVLLVLGFVPGLTFIFKKVKAKNYFQQLQQRIQTAASEIDNYLEQRVQILQNVSQLVNRAIDLDKDVMKSIAAFRSGANPDVDRNAVGASLDNAFARIFPQVEAYPELKAHEAIADAMRQNNYLQQEIRAARTFYNDTVTQWNTDIYSWPVKMIVAARSGYTTRIPFSASAETKERARGNFF